MVTYAAEQRVREIGIRKVLGASISNIASMLLTDFLKLIVILTVIAFPLAWWAMNVWSQSFTYRISAGIAALLIALLTISFQALKAAIASPVKSLRME